MNQNRYPETEPHIYQNLECDNDDIQNYWKGIILNDIETTSYSFGKVEFLGGSDDKEFACIARDPGLIQILKELGIPDHLTCLLRNLYAGQEATVRTRHGTTDWFHIGKEYIKAVHCHPAYLTYMQST